ncbi:MAG: hypothetical protein ACE5JG_13110 [Planctomycetota bacterium]
MFSALRVAIFVLILLTAAVGLGLEFAARTNPQVAGAKRFLWLSRAVVAVCGVAAILNFVAWYVI